MSTKQEAISLSNYYNTEKVTIALDHWSNSQDSDFRQCPLKWYRSHILRLQSRRERAVFAKGHALHLAFQNFYSLAPEEREQRVLMDAVDSLNKEAYIDPEEYSRDVKLLRRALESYWNTYKKDIAIPKSLTEQEENWPIPFVGIPYNFRMDVLALDTPEPFILDLKTGTSVDIEKFESFDMQLYRYFHAARMLGYPVVKIGWQLIKLPRSAKGEIELDRQFLYPTKKQIAYAIHDMAMIVEEATRDQLLLFPNYHRDCEYSCDWFSLCYTAKQGGDAKAVEEQLFIREGEEEQMLEDQTEG